MATKKKKQDVVRATHDSELKLGDVTLPCYVLEDGRRVFSQRGMTGAIGMAGRGGGQRLARFAESSEVKPHAGNDLTVAINDPIEFIPTHGGRSAYGYEANTLSELCEAVLSARDARSLTGRTLVITEQCEILVRGFARVGLVALIDEVTGYQEERDRDELNRLLEKYLSDEKLKWAKTFPDSFYMEIYRLKGWEYPKTTRQRTPQLGHITNEYVYNRLPEGVLEALRERNPRAPDKKTRLSKHHQWLSEDLGRPDLRDHLIQVIAIMRGCQTWAEFERIFARSFPGDGYQIELFDEPETDKP